MNGFFKTLSLRFLFNQVTKVLLDVQVFRELLVSIFWMISFRNISVVHKSNQKNSLNISGMDGLQGEIGLTGPRGYDGLTGEKGLWIELLLSMDLLKQQIHFRWPRITWLRRITRRKRRHRKIWSTRYAYYNFFFCNLEIIYIIAKHFPQNFMRVRKRLIVLNNNFCWFVIQV